MCCPGVPWRSLGARQAMVLRKSTEWQNESRLDIWTPVNTSHLRSENNSSSLTSSHLITSHILLKVGPCHTWSWPKNLLMSWSMEYDSDLPPQRHRKTRLERGLTEGTARCCVRSWHRQPTSCEVVSKDWSAYGSTSHSTIPLGHYVEMGRPQQGKTNQNWTRWNTYEQIKTNKNSWFYVDLC